MPIESNLLYSFKSYSIGDIDCFCIGSNKLFQENQKIQKNIDVNNDFFLIIQMPTKST